MSRSIPTWKSVLRQIPGIVPMWRLTKTLIDPAERSQWLIRRENPPGLFQPAGYTTPDRHPPIFAFLGRQLADMEAPRLLSFGCSTGEEVFSLRNYLPQAQLMGIDINPRSIAVCGKKLRRRNDPRIHFEQASSAQDQPDSYYDAILAIAVFRRGELTLDPPPQCCDHLIRFEDFEREVNELVRCLKPGGYLALRFNNFRFLDTAVSQQFEPVFHKTPHPLAYRDTPLYGRDNQLLPGQMVSELIFRKRLPEAS